MQFEFTDEQKTSLRSWANALENDNIRRLRSAEDGTVAKAKALLESTGFAADRDMTAEELGTFLGLARELAPNRQMNRTLYEGVGVEAFNAKLRSLLYGKEPLWLRLANIASIPRMGPLGASQMLCLSDPRKYPLVSKQCIDVIGLSPEQKESARADVIAEHGIIATHEEAEWVTKFLRRALILERARDLLKLRDYLDVNLLLFAQSLAVSHNGEEIGGLLSPPQDSPYTSVAFEAQLRDYIAEFPTVLGPGLAPWDPEQTTEYYTPIGQIDVMLRDGKVPVVVETKRDRSTDDVVGQALRYMGWWRGQGFKKVRGIIVVHRPDPKLDAAMLMLQGVIELRYYRLQFKFAHQPFPDQPQGVPE